MSTVEQLWNAYAAARIDFAEDRTEAAERRCMAAFRAWATIFLGDEALVDELVERLRCNLVRVRTAA